MSRCVFDNSLKYVQNPLSLMPNKQPVNSSCQWPICWSTHNIFVIWHTQMACHNLKCYGIEKQEKDQYILPERPLALKLARHDMCPWHPCSIKANMHVNDKRDDIFCLASYTCYLFRSTQSKARLAQKNMQYLCKHVGNLDTLGKHTICIDLMECVHEDWVDCAYILECGITAVCGTRKNVWTCRVLSFLSNAPPVSCAWNYLPPCELPAHGNSSVGLKFHLFTSAWCFEHNPGSTCVHLSVQNANMVTFCEMHRLSYICLSTPSRRWDTNLMSTAEAKESCYGTFSIPVI